MKLAGTTTTFQCASHLGCLRQFENRKDWVIVAVLEYAVDEPRHVVLHERPA